MDVPVGQQHAAREPHRRRRLTRLGCSRMGWMLLLGCAILLTACAPSATSNVIGYMISQRICDLSALVLRTDQVECFPTIDTDAPGGAITGVVRAGEQPLANASVVVAEPSGQPHAARTDAAGRYRIEDVPPGQYVVAGVAPGYEEGALGGWMDIPTLVTVESNETAMAPPLTLEPYQPPSLPTPLAPAVDLTTTATFTATAPYPPGAAAQVHAFEFTYDGATVDTLRLYLPLDMAPDARLPLIYAVYPLNVDGWQPVSVAFASQGYAVLAIAPIAARELDIEAHAQDALVALTLAQEGALTPHIADGPAVALGGSFSSPILHRLLRSAGDSIAGWVTIGGIADAFQTAADFYADRITLPERYQYAIPAFGFPNIHPVPFLRYSPIYTVSELPPTMVIHTDADRIILIDQAHDLEEALREAGVPVEVYYYHDVSHYLQIGEDLTEAGKEMFQRVLDFVQRVQQPDE
jgi:acetyl esterase/lipase